MPVEIFSKEQFESTLPCHPQTSAPMWEHDGLNQGEHCYRVSFGNPHVEIYIRSSVRADGTSAGCGNDSIRVWLVDAGTTKPLAKKLQKYVTRLPGWQERLQAMIVRSWEMSKHIRPCPTCGATLHVVDISKGSNAGKIALSCTAKDPNGKYLNHLFQVIEAD